MKKLSELNIAKDALLSEIQITAKGGQVNVGAGTNYYGPSNPSTLMTYLDGFPWGSDGMSGSLAGDSWSTDGTIAEGDGTLSVTSPPVVGG